MTLGPIACRYCEQALRSTMGLNVSFDGLNRSTVRRTIFDGPNQWAQVSHRVVIYPSASGRVMLWVDNNRAS